MEQLQIFGRRIFDAVVGFRRDNRQLFNLLTAALALAAVIGVGFYLINPGAPMVLAANLAPADRTALALRLRRHRIEFTLGPDSIVVPAHELTEARALLDGSPGFAGGGEDFGLFDHSPMGQSDFDEQVNYQRSLQGELERTIMDIHGIDSARVMLAMARPSPFALGPDEAARASVMLSTGPGATTDTTMARAIAHLVASSVHGLSTENVSVTGNDGIILFPPQHEGELGEAIRLRNDFEHRLQDKVAALLSRIMGENRYAVEVSVDVDTSRVTSKEQIYGKGDQTILSEEHTVTPVEAAPGGIPGLTSNLAVPSASPTPAAAPTAPVAGSNPQADKTKMAERDTASAAVARKDIVNYKPSTRTLDTLAAPVRIKRISVAAVLDGTYDSGRFKSLPEERLSAIKGLVAAAVGADVERGDSVDIQSAALSQPYVPPVLSPVIQLRALMSDPLHLYGTAGVALVLLLGMFWMVKRSISRRLRSRRAAVRTIEAARSAPLPDPLVHPDPLRPEQLPEAELAVQRSEYEELRNRVNEEVGRRPEAAAEILRKWMSAGSGTGNGAHNEPQVTE
jgi:flagellar M-ring protein FliF